MKIGGLQKLSTIDFPKYISCVVFCLGCNMDCFYCHNRKLISFDSDEVISEEEIFRFLKARNEILEGVVISGGEPTLQQDLLDFIKKIKLLGYKVKLDSNGLKPQIIEKILPYLDYLAIDIKATSDDYSKVCHSSKDSFKYVAETINILLKSKINFEGRTTMYPKMTINDLINILKSIPPLPRYRLNFYKKPIFYKEKDEDLINEVFITKDEISINIEKLLQYQPNLIVV
ncbi:MAG: anaerobic ribonucleoside-triphosphate reductase activating protein [Bacilli bacterium]|nr:anaerobic ribonucleoside-triphosphate reductase activating protein [Bacilli bacterium]